VADDEWHGLMAVLRGYGWILTHFGEADHSIGLAVLERTLFATVGLSEATLRLPTLLVSVATLVLLPVLLPRAVDWWARSAFAWLLALAPMHIYFSRYARPYAMTILFVSVGIIAFARWWDEGSTKWGWVFAACAFLGACFHLTALPALAAPVLCAWGARATGWWVPVGSASSYGLTRVSLAGAIAVAIAIGPPLWFDFAALRLKAQAGIVDADTLRSAVGLYTGATSGWMMLGLSLGAAIGLVALWRQGPRLAACLVAAVALSLGTTLMTRPAYVQVPMVFARYNSILLPVVLLALAVALSQVDEWVSGRIRLMRRGLLSALVTAVVVLTGPLPSVCYNPNNWTNHAIFQYTYDPGSKYAYGPALKPVKMPSFYESLSRHRPGDLLIMEAPWYLAWHYNLQPFYQQVHRQRTVIGLVDGQYPYSPSREFLSIPGVRLKLFVDPEDQQALCRLGVDYAVFHGDLRTEMARGEAPAIDVTGWVELYRRRYGRPVFTDEKITVFAVGEAACGPR
jgi:hypothetical protein